MRKIFLVLVTTAAFFSASLAQATGVADWGWGVSRWDLSASSPDLKYYVDSSAAAAKTMVQQAFADWASIPSVYVTFTEVSDPAQANITVKLYGSLSTGGAAGVAMPISDSNGHITSCEIALSGEYTLTKNTVQHETGHCLGLGHSVVSGAVMSYRNGGESPQPDDQYALTLLYPKDGTAKLPVGCATIAQMPNSGGDGRGSQGSQGSKEAFYSSCLLFLMVSTGFLALRSRRYT